MKIAVVGGGLGGCAAARDLGRAGHRVILFEKAAVLGGLAGSFHYDDFHLEKFYHHIFRHDRPIIELIQELGLSTDLLWRKARMGFYTGGRLHEFSTPIDLLRFTPLRPADRLRFARSVLFFKKLGAWEPLQAVTARDWYYGRSAGPVYETVWRPLLRQKFGDAEPEISAAWLWGRVNPRARSRQWGREQLGYLKGGFHRVFLALEQQIAECGGTIQKNTPVERILFGDGGRVRGIATAAGTWACDAVLWTPPLPLLTGAAAGLPEGLKEKLNAVSYRGVVCLVFFLEAPAGKIYWINIADPAPPFGCVIEHTNFIPSSHYGGVSVVYVSNYVRITDPQYRLSPESLTGTVLPHLKNLLPRFEDRQVRARFLFRDDYATPVYGRNYREVLPPCALPVPGLFLATTAQIYPYDRNMSNSVRVAREAAACMLRGIGKDR
jgi:protoporphyrinogen oxidase